MSVPPAEYRYDVAFSFLSQDESVARDLNNRLTGRLETFIYSDAERQATIAGTDGEETFGQVFGEQARTVVILYREGWGNSGFTAAESTAIRNRAFKFGHDFLTLIPLGSPPTTPVWFPRNRLWIGLEQYGPAHAASVIESRAREAGSTARPDSISDLAERMKRLLAARKRRAGLLDSMEGVEAARECFTQLKEEVARAAGESSGLVILEKSTNPDVVGLRCHRYTATFAFQLAHANTLKGAELRLAWFKGGSRPLRPPAETYAFDVDGEEVGWRDPSNPRHELLTARRLADQTVRRLLFRLEESDQDD
ncbi:MAG: hypothetical protein IT177_01560 [Acidobacteria bacterium]|nr:hypothetical protein [Acidobacteriota bacterium]